MMRAHVAARERMIQTHLRSRGVRDRRVLAAMADVPRERFVGRGMQEFAYEDSPLPIEEGQTISQPYVIARMLEAARIGERDNVLDVGTGSGYSAALMGRLARHVHTVERVASLAAQARERFEAMDAANVEVHVGDGSTGWPSAAPFDAIVVAAGAPEPPEALRAQLVVGGRLVIPVGDAGVQELLLIRRLDERRFRTESLGAVMFVPLVGEQGWTEDGRPAQAQDRDD